jgi:carbohydrate 6-sulfotransferase 6
MSNYKFPDGENSYRGKTLDDLALATGGTPIRSIIVSTWRSGSSFFGDILKNVPGNFYFYEPLAYLSLNVIKENEIEEAVRHVHKLFNCDFDNMEKYFSKTKDWLRSMKENINFWESFNRSRSLMTEKRIVEPFCKICPIQIMKFIRLRLKVAAKFLEDPK